MRRLGCPEIRIGGDLELWTWYGGSIYLGYTTTDAMLKAANVDMLLARSICSGKFMVAVGGDVAGVEAAVQALAFGETAARHEAGGALDQVIRLDEATTTVLGPRSSRRVR